MPPRVLASGPLGQNPASNNVDNIFVSVINVKLFVCSHLFCLLHVSCYVPISSWYNDRFKIITLVAVQNHFLMFSKRTAQIVKLFKTQDKPKIRINSGFF